jgi:hypothetical protein
MQKTIHRTSRWGLGTMIHAIHVGEDVATLNAFYEDVFGGLLFMGIDEPNFLPPEKRLASLLMIGDLCVETMAPQPPVDPATPVGKFFTKFGSHWHSIGYQIEDFAGIGAHLQAQGVFLGKPGGGEMSGFDEHVYFYPHPRHVGGVMVECCKVEMYDDPRLRPEWSSLRKLWMAHPLGIDRLGWITIAVTDIEHHLELWQRLFEVIPVHEETNDADGRRSQFVHFGDILVELAMPIEPGTALADHVAEHGDMIYSATLKVLDLDGAEAHLKSKGIAVSRPDAETLVADPLDTHGAPWSFTTRTIPNDPFDQD